MGEKSAKKVRNHSDLEDGEQVVDACYGLGKGTLQLADATALGTVRRYTRDATAATTGPEGAGAAIDRNGILAFTDRRVLFLPVKLAVTKPKAVAAAWPLTQLTGVSWENNMLAVGFADGSIGGLHVPRAEHPSAFVDALMAQLDAV